MISSRASEREVEVPRRPSPPAGARRRRRSRRWRRIGDHPLGLRAHERDLGEDRVDPALGLLGDRAPRRARRTAPRPGPRRPALRPGRRPASMRPPPPRLLDRGVQCRRSRMPISPPKPHLWSSSETSWVSLAVGQGASVWAASTLWAVLAADSLSRSTLAPSALGARGRSRPRDGRRRLLACAAGVLARGRGGLLGGRGGLPGTEHLLAGALEAAAGDLQLAADAGDGAAQLVGLGTPGDARLLGAAREREAACGRRARGRRRSARLRCRDRARRSARRRRGRS